MKSNTHQKNTGKRSRVVLTGGGTAGHVMPNLALLPELKEQGFEVYYIGSKDIERQLALAAGLPFISVSSGKLRRYFSFENLLDIFRLFIGIIQSVYQLMRLSPDVIFSKGGFVAVPVCVAGRLLNIPIVSHESDVTPGMANRIIGRFATILLYSFPDTKKFLGSLRSEHVATPVRAELFAGDRQTGLKLCGFDETYPVLLVMGGSQGAQRINEALLHILPSLVERYQIIHITGKGKSLNFSHPHYKSFEFVTHELKDLFAATDLVISRAGANSIFEMLALKKPMLLIPLEQGSRGDQVVNAESFCHEGWALMLHETKLDEKTLAASIAELAEKSSDIRAKQRLFSGEHGAKKIVEILSRYCRNTL